MQQFSDTVLPLRWYNINIMSKQKRAAVYTRVSTDEQSKHGLSLGVQESTCRAIAETDGYIVTDDDIFVDDGYSGRSVKRPAYQMLLSKLADYDVIYAIRLDRYSRSVRDVFALLDECSRHNTLLKAVHSKIDLSSAMGRAMVGVSAVFAALESELIQERVLEVVADVASRGRTITKPPFGYTLPAPKAVIVPDSVTAPIVVSIFRDYANGKPLVTICQELNAAGVPKTRSNADWVPVNIRYMLSCPTYIGKVKHRDNIHMGLHEAIIDEQTWAKCQLRLASNARVASRARNGSLSPLLVCGFCGCNLHATKSGRGVRFYTCAASKTAVKKHPSVYIRDYIVEGYIWLLVEEMLSAEAEPFYKEAVACDMGGDGRIDVLRNEKRQLEEKIKYNVMAASEAGLAMHLLSELNGPLQDRLADVEVEMRLETDGACGVGDELLMMEGLEVMKSSDFEKKRQFLSSLLRKVDVFDDRVVFWSQAGGLEPLSVKRQKFIGKEDKVLVLHII